MTDSVETIDSGEDEERQVSWADNSPPMFEAESDTEAAAATEAQARDPVVQVVDLDGPLVNPNCLRVESLHVLKESAISRS